MDEYLIHLCRSVPILCAKYWHPVSGLKSVSIRNNNNEIVHFVTCYCM